MIRQSVSKKTKKQKTKIDISQETDNSTIHVKSSVKRESKFTSSNFREDDRKKKKFMHHNLDDNKKEQLKENDKIRKRQICDNLDIRKKERDR